MINYLLFDVGLTTWWSLIYHTYILKLLKLVDVRNSFCLLEQKQVGLKPATEMGNGWSHRHVCFYSLQFFPLESNVLHPCIHLQLNSSFMSLCLLFHVQERIRVAQRTEDRVKTQTLQPTITWTKTQCWHRLYNVVCRLARCNVWNEGSSIFTEDHLDEGTKMKKWKISCRHTIHN